jgi:hypothetical protein
MLFFLSSLRSAVLKIFTREKATCGQYVQLYMYCGLSTVQLLHSRHVVRVRVGGLLSSPRQWGSGPPGSCCCTGLKIMEIQIIVLWYRYDNRYTVSDRLIWAVPLSFLSIIKKQILSNSNTTFTEFKIFKNTQDRNTVRYLFHVYKGESPAIHVHSIVRTAFDPC